MMRIDLMSQTPEEVVLRVSGEVTAPEGKLLVQEVEPWLAQGCRVVLDLTYAWNVNVDGMAVLYRWARQGAAVEWRHLKDGLQGFLRAFFQQWDEEGGLPEDQ